MIAHQLIKIILLINNINFNKRSAHTYNILQIGFELYYVTRFQIYTVRENKFKSTKVIIQFS